MSPWSLVAHALGQRFGNGVRGVHDQVQQRLTDQVTSARQVRQVVIDLRLDLGHILPFAAGDGDRGCDDLADVHRDLVDARRMREGLHRADDACDVFQPLLRLGERVRDLPAQVVELGAAQGGVEVRQQRGVGVAGTQGGDHRDAAIGQRQQRGGGHVDEAHVVGHVLRRGVDLVRDAGGQLADRFHLLRLQELRLRLSQLAQRFLQRLSFLLQFAGLAGDHVGQADVLFEQRERRVAHAFVLLGEAPLQRVYRLVARDQLVFQFVQARLDVGLRQGGHVYPPIATAVSV